MFANRIGRAADQPKPNLAAARAAWGDDMPQWVQLLAHQCDASNQAAVAHKLGRSGGFVSRIINQRYTASYEEAEQLVRAHLNAEDVECPLYGPIPLASCMQQRRRKGSPQNFLHRQFAATCPTCPFNGDAP